MLFSGVLGYAFSFAEGVTMIREYEENHSTQIIFPLAFFVMVVIDTFLIILISFGGMSNVFKESMKIFENSKRLQCQLVVIGVPRKIWVWQAKFFKSCAAVLVKFGSNNSVEELTPLNSLNYSLRLAVQLLLLQG